MTHNAFHNPRYGHSAAGDGVMPVSTEPRQDQYRLASRFRDASAPGSANAPMPPGASVKEVPLKDGLLLEFYTKGYVVLNACLRQEAVDGALAACHRVWRDRPVCVDRRSKNVFLRNNVYLHSEELNAILMSSAVISFAESVFGDRVVATNAIALEHGTESLPHVDHLHFVSPDAALTSWVALEDVHPDSGPLIVWPGSQEIPPFHFAGEPRYRFGGLECRVISDDLHAVVRQHLARNLGDRPGVPLLLTKGDVAILHPMLVHSGAAVRCSTRTRRSMIGNYCNLSCLGDPPDGIYLNSFGRAYYITGHWTPQPS